MSQDTARLLRSLYVTIFLISTSFGAVTFLLPVFAKELGASYVALGVIGAVGSATYTVMTLVSGALLDRFNRVRLYLASSIFGTIVVLLFSAVTRVNDLMMVRGMMGIVSAAFWVTASTLVADTSPPEALTRSIGRYNISWIAGFTAGPFIGGLISDLLGFPILFLILAALIAVGVVVIWTELPAKMGSGDGAVRRGFDLSALKGLYTSYLTILPYSLILGIYMAILPGQMRVLGITSSIIGFLLTMTNGVRGLTFFHVERFVGWGERRSLCLASWLMSAALFAVAFSRDMPSFLAPLVMFGLAGGIITPLIQNSIARRSPRHALGTVMGVHESIYGIGMCVGPLLGGAIAEAFRPVTLYLSLALLSLVILPLSRGFGVEAQQGPTG